MSLFALLLLFFLLWFIVIPLVKLLWRANRQARQWRDFYRQATGQGASTGHRGSPFGGFGRAAKQQEPAPQKRKKVFTKDVGEYVDFEEITDTETATSSPEGSTYERSHTESRTRYSDPREDQVTDADWEDIP